jgi:hypothetical protein
MIKENFEIEPSNCFQCIHRETVPGSAHSSCTLYNTELSGYMLANEVVRGNMLQIKLEVNGEERRIPVIKVDPHGIKNGWAFWPVNFDPVWVSECIMFKTQEDERRS